MSGLPIIDLLIGMIFIYFLLSIICSSAVELWLSVNATRSKLLRQWLVKVFNEEPFDFAGKQITGKKLGEAIIEHCTTVALADSKTTNDYINSENFVSALLDHVTRPITPVTIFTPPPSSIGGYITAIQNTTAIGPELKKTFLAFAYDAQNAAALLAVPPGVQNVVNNINTTVKSDLDDFKERLKRWYDTNADRLTGKMKRVAVLPSTIILATIITVSLNADTISMSNYLYNHPAESHQFADKAVTTINSFEERVNKIRAHEEEAKNIATGAAQKAVLSDSAATARLDTSLQNVKQDVAEMKAALPAALPIGWTNNGSWYHHIPGWLVTILAIVMGAPFWFDVLNKIANVRGAGPKPVSTAEDDRKK